MFKILTRALALILALQPVVAAAQVPSWPQTVPQQTVVGRLGITPGPTQAIPISQLSTIFGASRSVTTNAKCDGSTDDTVAINADLAQGGYWTLPANRTCNVTQLNITVSGTRLSGNGYNSSIIQGTTAAAPTINISATLSNVWLNDFQVTKSVTATSGGHGIKFNGDCQYCVIDGVYAQKSYVGIALQSTGVANMRHVLAQYNLSDGISLTNSAVSGTLQWDLDDVFSGQNVGRGFFVAPSVAGPTGITLGSWHNVRTFANTGVGAAFVGTVAIPINGIRITKALFGQDGNHEIYLDTYGGLHSIGGLTYLELAGTSLTGPTFATPASNTGDGIRVTANNYDVSISDVYINGNHDSGINTSASLSTNVSGHHISNHGLYGILAADCAKLTVTSVNFVSNAAANIQCTSNNGAQQVVTSTPAAVNNVIAAAVALGGISGMSAGCPTWLATSTSANLRACLTDETGTGAAYFQGGDLGTPSAGVGTNITALNASNLASGTVPNARLNTSGAPAQIGAVAAVKSQKFTANGTYTPSTGLLYAVAECVGSGGGGGGVTGGAGSVFGGGGGGSGGYSRIVLTAATIGASKAVTIGTAGPGGTAGSNNGTAGGDTSLGTLCIGKGGSGGQYSSAAQVPGGGAGGVAGTGDLTSAGQGGGAGSYITTPGAVLSGSGFGGSSAFGGGAAGVTANNGVSSVGTAGGNYGGGGSGGIVNQLAANAAGGSGSAGVVLITEYTNQ